VTGTLILLRHGSSEWNEQGRFTGWMDVPLGPAGLRQARRAGELLVAAGLPPDRAHSSLLTRATRTAETTLAAAGRPEVAVAADWRLNERHYGVLQGRAKRDVVAEFGPDRFAHWRRSWQGAPPPLPDDDPASPAHDPRYAHLGADLPRTESLADVHRRLLPHWRTAILPDLATGATVLVTSHSNTLRALIKHLERIADADIDTVNVPTGIPLVYRLDAEARAVEPGRYLDPEAAAAGSAAVAGEGLDPAPRISR
jgi:2,3-bisphosphoglycerate-dependent phosphoglycerate mutase